jgi:hypothetical protein
MMSLDVIIKQAARSTLPANQQDHSGSYPLESDALYNLQGKSSSMHGRFQPNPRGPAPGFRICDVNGGHAPSDDTLKAEIKRRTLNKRMIYPQNRQKRVRSLTQWLACQFTIQSF